MREEEKYPDILNEINETRSCAHKAQQGDVYGLFSSSVEWIIDYVMNILKFM